MHCNFWILPVTLVYFYLALFIYCMLCRQLVIDFSDLFNMRNSYYALGTMMVYWVIYTVCQ